MGNAERKQFHLESFFSAAADFQVESNTLFRRKALSRTDTQSLSRTDSYETLDRLGGHFQDFKISSKCARNKEVQRPKSVCSELRMISPGLIPGQFDTTDVGQFDTAHVGRQFDTHIICNRTKEVPCILYPKLYPVSNDLSCL